MPGIAWLAACDWVTERRAGKALAPTIVLALKNLSQVQQACCLSVPAEIYIPLVETSSVSNVACASGGGAMARVNCGFGPYAYIPHANHMPARPWPVNDP